MDTLRIRDAEESDLSAINDIYNHYVLSSTCTYQYAPSTAQERAAWFGAHGPAHPVTVATAGGSGELVGWGALSSYRSREGYRRTVENTVYVRAGLHRRGVGRALLDDLIARARRLGHRTILATISADQDASVALHRAAGFETVARLREVGFKFDAWLDVVYMQLLLDGA